MINNLFLRILTSLFLIILLFFCLFYSDLSWKILVITFSILCCIEFYNLIKKIFKKKNYLLISFLLIVVYLYFFSYLLIKIRIDIGKEIVLILILACVFSDIGGYVVGRLIGGPKLSSISPNKTISGAFGSIVFTVVGTSLFSLYLGKINKDFTVLDAPIVIFIWLIIISIICQIGDLFVSYLKRKAKQKDTGFMLPGHGGILDRVDGIIFAIPVGFLIYLTFITN